MLNFFRSSCFSAAISKKNGLHQFFTSTDRFVILSLRLSFRVLLHSRTARPRKTKKGRKYYGCENNPECDFMSWQKPSAKKCPQCGGYMLEKGNKLVCADEQCGYVEAREKKDED